MKKALLILLSFSLISCSFGGRTNTTQTPDGSIARDTAVYAQLGGKGGFIANGGAGFTMQVDNEKSFGQAVTAGGTAYGLGQWASVENTRAATSAATTQTGIKATAATDQARIQATQATATSVGNNPDANTGALNAVRGLFR